mgnify:CR=1 FL=1
MQSIMLTRILLTFPDHITKRGAIVAWCKCYIQMQEQNWLFHKTPYLNCLSVFSEYIDSNNCFVKLGVRWLNKLIIQMFLKGNVIDNMENQQIL